MVQVLRHSLAFVLVVGLFDGAFAQQGISKEQTISFLNDQLKTTDVLTLKGKNLLISSSRNGEPIKEDKINIYDLNPKTVKYNADQSLVMVRCFDDVDGCVERKTLKVSRKSYRNRVTFGVSSAQHGEKVVNALTHLVNMHAYKDYKGVTSFE